MSRRRSTGDLVPRDISEILAREARAQRGQRKPGSSLGQAFSWLRGSRRKKNLSKGLNRDSAGVTENKLGLQNHDAAKAGTKGNEDQKRLTVHYTASQHYQENVFIEGSRSQYLEDLHTEAQEGLKILQQEEHQNGVNLADDESIASTDTLCPEQDISSKDRSSSPESRSTTGNPDTTVTSAALTRPVLTRQGSTFKPLNPVKKTERSRKRSRRTTIMGIPNQVQKELALHRSSTFQPLVSTQLPNQRKPDSESQSSVIIIPTIDGGTPVVNKEGARVHLSELETFRDAALVSEHLQSHLCPTSALRPNSLAVPGMTTSFSYSPSTFNFLLEPQGPVMSISPQATYLSTIIPNAVLPASVEVIEIDRSISRTRGGSVNHGSNARTVSKSSLTSGDSAVSPLLSRRSDGDGSQTNSSNYDTDLMPKSASGSNWSESQSSKTIMSDSLSVSSNKVGLNPQESQTEQSKYQDLASLQSSVSGISSSSSKGENSTESRSECGATESMAAGEQAKCKHNFTHSLSVVKTKQPPAPPRRTNSLHGCKIRSSSKTVVDIKDISNSASEEERSSAEDAVTEDGTKLMVSNISTIPTPASNSIGCSSAESSSTPLMLLDVSSNPNGEAAETPREATSPSQKNPPEGENFERTMSPSSGYSSQSGTPTLSPKDISPTSPDKQKTKPVKPERSTSRASSSAASPSSSLTSLSSGTSELANADLSTCSTSLSPRGTSPPVKELTPSNNPSNFRVEVRELFNIPPPPKVKAPCPPPPETWVHNKHTVELLCGPCPHVDKVLQKPAQIQDSTDEETEVQMEFRNERQVKDENLTTINKSVQEMSVNNTKQVEQEIRESSATKQVQDEEKAEIQRVESSTSVAPEIQETTPKRDPPPIMKKPTRVVFSEDTQRLDLQQRGMSSSAATKVPVFVENHVTSSQNTVMIVVDETENTMEKGEIASMQTLSVEIPKISKISPPPTPPPAYQPTPPLMRKTPSSSICSPPKELERQQELTSVEDPCWPPPPPPLEGLSVFDGGDEVDFPPPPPPSLADSVVDVIETTPAISQSSLTENVQVLKTDMADEASCQPVQNVVCNVDSVPPPLVELPCVSPVIRAESPVLVTVVPPSSYPKRNSLKPEDQSPFALSNAQITAPSTLSTAPPPPTENSTHFRRQPAGAHRDNRSKELLSRQKSPPIPKEDANIPLVTPSLLQMVRLRSVSMTEDQVKTTSEYKSTSMGAQVQENYPVSIHEPQNIPQKPIRKSLSQKSSPQTVKTSTVTMTPPSTRLQEAIRMKTAAMSSRDGLPPRMTVRLPTYGYTGEPVVQSMKSPEGYEMHKSPASTASFIFSRSTKKMVIETVGASSSEAQASLKQSLAAELRQVSDQSKAGTFSNGGVKYDKVPPPVAKKPSSLSPSQISHNPLVKLELSVEENGALGEVQHVSGVAPPKTTTRVTADTIETLF